MIKYEPFKQENKQFFSEKMVQNEEETFLVIYGTPQTTK